MDALDRLPARRVLQEAADTNRRLGHANRGALSEAHGFLPEAPPLRALPPAFAAWDEAAAALPHLYRTLALRRTLDALPLLEAGPGGLPDAALSRAATLLSIFAHAYHHVRSEPAARLPAAVEQPWRTVCRRLGRTEAALTYSDLIVNNWRLVDPEGPRHVSNLQLLVPTVDNREERVFYLTQVEMLAQGAPLVGAVVRAQEAALRENRAALGEELRRIADVLQAVTYRSFARIDPNPHSATFTDPVLWAKTVAPLAVPVRGSAPGPSGTASPLFHLMDVFFRRPDYDSTLGRDALRLRTWFPPHWQHFLDALGAVTVGDYVDQSGSEILRGLYRAARAAYAGPNGLLDRHRLKVYGYLDTAFKVGRSSTVGGFSGGIHERLWEQVDDELETARRSRLRRQDPLEAAGLAYYLVRVKAVRPTQAGGTDGVKQVVLDVDGTGLRYRPGDRCGILPENGPGLVAKTLAALRAEGGEPVLLTRRWCAALALRDGFEEEVPDVLPVRTLLRFGAIRPVTRPVAKRLYRLTHDETLRRIIEARAEDQWELWDLLAVLRRGGFDPRRLWRAHPGEAESLCRIVPPERFRMYSISSAAEATGCAKELHLTVGRLRYRTQDTHVTTAAERRGTASDFLGTTLEQVRAEGRRLTVQVVHPPRFSLPDDPARPVVLFAAGTGLAPFRSFLLARMCAAAGPTWLFYGTRTRADLHYRDELAEWAAQERLHLRVAFSAEDVHLIPNGDGLAFVPGARRRIDEVIAEEGETLWALLRPERSGGGGACVYVCGRTGFAATVMDGLHAVFQKHAGGAADRYLDQLVGEGRYLQEIFTTYPGAHIEQRRIFDASEIVLHNTAERGRWLVVSGRVYDCTRFAAQHPGGDRLIAAYAGTDATAAYQKVQHHLNTEVDAMLGMYEIGAVRRLDFGREWGVVLGPERLRFVLLSEAFRMWVRFLYLIVEMENALANATALQEGVTTRDEPPASPPAERSLFKLQAALQTHARFMTDHLPALEQGVQELWRMTAGLCDAGSPAPWMQSRLEALRRSPEAQRAAALHARLAARLERAVKQGAAADPALAEDLERRAAAERDALHEMKKAVRRGLIVFETYERETLHRGAETLMNTTGTLPDVLADLYARLAVLGEEGQRSA